MTLPLLFRRQLPRQIFKSSPTKTRGSLESMSNNSETALGCSVECRNGSDRVDLPLEKFSHFYKYTSGLLSVLRFVTRCTISSR